MKQVDIKVSDRTLSPEEAEEIMEKIYTIVFNKSYREPRSNEYKNGFRAAAYNRLVGSVHALTRKTLPYPVGSVQADAWFAGNVEGEREADLWMSIWMSKSNRDRSLQIAKALLAAESDPSIKSSPYSFM